MSTTPTPRTDKAVTLTFAAGHNTVCPNFARQLERELIAASAQLSAKDSDIARLRSEVQECARALMVHSLSPSASREAMALEEVAVLRSQNSTLQELHQLDEKLIVQRTDEVRYLQDALDLMRDQLIRIQCLVGKKDEIYGICERGMLHIVQRVPIIAQRDAALAQVAELQADKDRLDWLEKNNILHQRNLAEGRACSLRAAIDSARTNPPSGAKAETE